jgi:hypothetical protein
MKRTKLVKWHDEALEFGRRKDSFIALNPRDNPISWSHWRKWFLDNFGLLPQWFRIVENEHKYHPGSQKSWTAPIDNPASYRP